MASVVGEAAVGGDPRSLSRVIFRRTVCVAVSMRVMAQQSATAIVALSGVMDSCWGKAFVRMGVLSVDRPVRRSIRYTMSRMAPTQISVPSSSLSVASGSASVR
jgi:hypothetical protein